MFRKLSRKYPNPILDNEQLQKLVIELTPQNQEAISGSGGFRFPCDGPGRGGTCGDISSLDY